MAPPLSASWLQVASDINYRKSRVIDRAGPVVGREPSLREPSCYCVGLLVVCGERKVASVCVGVFSCHDIYCCGQENIIPASRAITNLLPRDYAPGAPSVSPLCDPAPKYTTVPRRFGILHEIRFCRLPRPNDTNKKTAIFTGECNKREQQLSVVRSYTISMLLLFRKESSLK